jgi:GNAT superfamily N-acetyltransferase
LRRVSDVRERDGCRHGEIGSIVYRGSPPVASEDLNSLFAAAWVEHSWLDFDSVFRHSLAYVCAYHEERLVGFTNLAWDGGAHAFLLNLTVHPNLRRRGVGRQLVREAIRVARDRGVEWLHVDFEPHLRNFYRQCGFRDTEAGLVHLDPDAQA